MTRSKFSPIDHIGERTREFVESLSAGQLGLLRHIMDELSFENRSYWYEWAENLDTLAATYEKEADS
jgi:hypothetical protein